MFAAVDQKNQQRMTLMVINKHQRERYRAAIDVGRQGGCRSAEVYRLGPHETEIEKGGADWH